MPLTRILLPCLLIACLPLLAACGGDDSDGACRSGRGGGHGGSGGFGGHHGAGGGMGGGMGGGGMAGGMDGGMGGGMGGGGFSMGGGGMHRGMGGMSGGDDSSPAPCAPSSHAKGKASTRMHEVTPDQATIGDEQH
ncbi:hypothetical protein ACMAUO_16375 [Gluconacetobacter sp. Hr-1-5]|uniref:hypothetical protein n=1 Tax=Gluconacetobacter sp. Hr-1-5 TaxID=3395370 RepID=UPI003B515E6F